MFLTGKKNQKTLQCYVLPQIHSVCRPCYVCSVHSEPSEKTAAPSSCCFLLTESDDGLASTSPHLDCTPDNRVRRCRFCLHLSVVKMCKRTLSVFHTSAWKEDTEKTPRRPSMLLEGRLATARRLLGFGSSLPCRLDR